MTFFDLVRFMVALMALLIGATLGADAGAQYGFLGKSLGLFLGLLLGGIVGVALAQSASFLQTGTSFLMCRLNESWRFSLPVCRNGSCESRDYERSGWAPAKTAEEADKNLPGEAFGRRVRCRCGTEYFLCGRQFKEALADGSLRRYMKCRPFGRKWGLDDLA